MDGEHPLAVREHWQIPGHTAGSRRNVDKDAWRRLALKSSKSTDIKKAAPAIAGATSLASVIKAKRLLREEKQAAAASSDRGAV